MREADWPITWLTLLPQVTSIITFEHTFLFSFSDGIQGTHHHHIVPPLPLHSHVLQPLWLNNPLSTDYPPSISVLQPPNPRDPNSKHKQSPCALGPTTIKTSSTASFCALEFWWFVT